MSRSERTANGDHDNRGRFASGNGAARGHAGPRSSQYAKALRRVVPPERASAIFDAVAKQAESGDVAACKLFLSYTVGRPREAPEEAPGGSLKLGAIQTASDCAAAFSALLDGLSAGTVSVDQAARLAGVIELARRAAETAGLEDRLRALEAIAAGAVGGTDQ